MATVSETQPPSIACSSQDAKYWAEARKRTN
jgi:hypothetical protein